MTAPPDWSAHLAAVEAGGPEAVRAHLAVEHPVTGLRGGLVPPHDPAWTLAEYHRYIHSRRDQPTEAPA